MARPFRTRPNSKPDSSVIPFVQFDVDHSIPLVAPTKPARQSLATWEHCCCPKALQLYMNMYEYMSHVCCVCESVWHHNIEDMHVGLLMFAVMCFPSLSFAKLDSVSAFYPYLLIMVFLDLNPDLPVYVLVCLPLKQKRGMHAKWPNLLPFAFQKLCNCQARIAVFVYFPPDVAWATTIHQPSLKECHHLGMIALTKSSGDGDIVTI